MGYLRTVAGSKLVPPSQRINEEHGVLMTPEMTLQVGDLNMGLAISTKIAKLLTLLSAKKKFDDE